MCVTVEICEGVSSQHRRVSERKLIIPPSAAFWLSWRSRYSVVLLFGVQLELMVSLSRLSPDQQGKRFDRPGWSGEIGTWSVRECWESIYCWFIVVQQELYLQRTVKV